MWIAVKNWTDPDGKTWEHKIAHVGARTQGIGEVFPLEFELRTKFEDPEVTVDGLQSFQDPTFVDAVDPDMKADRMVYNKFNTLHGLSVERRVYAFSQEYHDDYHITEYILENTGNIDEDPDIELPNQTLEGLYFTSINKNTMNLGASSVIDGAVAWGDNQMSDFVGDGMQDYENDYRAYYVWHGRLPGFTRYNNLGAPVWNDNAWAVLDGDSTGRLMASEFLGRLTLHASTSGSDDTDDREQPSTTKTDNSNIWTNTSAWDDNVMRDEYNWITTGHQYPHHADLIVPKEEYPDLSWGKRMARQKQHPFGNKPGKQNVGQIVSYGPYTLEPGQSIRIVWAEGAQGLSRLANVRIGREYKRSGGDDEELISYDANGNGVIDEDETMTKNEWVMTSRDSLFKMFGFATANWEADMEIPEPPRPPRSFTVTSGTDRIRLEWETYNGANPQGFEIYRSRNSFRGSVSEEFQYEHVADLGPGERRYEDTEVQRGINYYYYIQAVGEENNDPTARTPVGEPLKSNRYYTQTFDPAYLLRPEGDQISDVQVVPNPYTLASDKEVRWPDQRNQIAFLEIPGECTIKIYTERGDLVQTLRHTDGSGDEYWNLRTSSNQQIVSGLYIAVIEDLNTGAATMKKFSIIR
jgi:hypothetical protein